MILFSLVSSFLTDEEFKRIGRIPFPIEKQRILLQDKLYHHEHQHVCKCITSWDDLPRNVSMRLFNSCNVRRCVVNDFLLVPATKAKILAYIDGDGPQEEQLFDWYLKHQWNNIEIVLPRFNNARALANIILYGGSPLSLDCFTFTLADGWLLITHNDTPLPVGKLHEDGYCYINSEFADTLLPVLNNRESFNCLEKYIFDS